MDLNDLCNYRVYNYRFFSICFALINVSNFRRPSWVKSWTTDILNICGRVLFFFLSFGIINWVFQVDWWQNFLLLGVGKITFVLLDFVLLIILPTVLSLFQISKNKSYKLVYKSTLYTNFLQKHNDLNDLCDHRIINTVFSYFFFTYQCLQFSTTKLSQIMDHGYIE